MCQIDAESEVIQKRVNKANKLRSITIKICWVLTPIMFVLFCIVSITANSFPEEFSIDFWWALYIGCGLHGLVHCGYLIKKIVLVPVKCWKKAGPIIAFLAFFPTALILASVLAIVVMVGFIYEIVDTIFFIKKKSLVYKRDVERFCKEEEKKQAEEYGNLDPDLVAQMVSNSDSATAMENLKALQKMMEDGVITKEEFNSKKEELMERI